MNLKSLPFLNHVINSQRKAALELDLEQFNDDNFSSGGIIAVYWDMGLAANSVPSTTSVALTMVLRTRCMVTRRRHNEIIIMSPEPDGAPGKKDQTIRSGQRIWWCRGMSGSKVDFKWSSYYFVWSRLMLNLKLNEIYPARRSWHDSPCNVHSTLLVEKTDMAPK